MKKRIILYTMVLGWMTSCEQFVDLEPPKNLLPTELVFSSDETAISAMMNIYISMNDSKALPYYTSVIFGQYSDELRSYSNSIGFRLAYSNAYTPVDGPTMNFWRTGYNLIYQANSIIEGCRESKLLSERIKKTLSAEAHFFRAYWHFVLTNIYGDIPIVGSTDYTVNSNLTKKPRRDVLENVINDLLFAETELPEDYLAGNYIAVSNDRIRVNSFSATALLSRAYLFAGDFERAKNCASKVIEAVALYDLVDIKQVFIKNNRESILQLMQPMPNATTLNTYEGMNYILSARPGTGLQNCTSLSDDLLKSFEKDDLRRLEWVGKFTDVSVNPNKDYYFPFKYKSRSATSVTEYSVCLRLAEQYLIRAEARLLTGDSDGALADLNRIRVRAGLKPLSDLDITAIHSAIFSERRVELFCEMGMRFFDMKRTGRIDSIMEQVSPGKGGVWAPYKKDFPIPQSEIENNPSLTQNEGYD